MELESLNSQSDEVILAGKKIAQVLQACRNSLNSASVVITKSSSQASSIDDRVQKEIEAIFERIGPDQRQSYESIFKSTPNLECCD